MGSQGNNNGNPSNTTRATHDPDPKPGTNPPGRQGSSSLYSLTLDEVQNQLLGGLGKPLSSMNLDELLKSVWIAEGSNSQGGLNFGPSPPPQPDRTPSADLSKKTVDEVWQDIQHGRKKGTLDRNATLGEMTLEDFLVKAGVVAEPSAQWAVNYTAPSIMPVYAPVVAPYGDGQVNLAVSSPGMGGGGGFSDAHQAPRRKRAGPEDVAERSVERRQKRMIKNRESAARSRARKQAYTHELENKISRLEEENERLRRQHEWEKVLPTIPPPPEPKHRLRRTSSASF